MAQAQAVFYNLSGKDLALRLNDPRGTAAPTPSQTARTFSRYDTDRPRRGQFGNKNSVSYDLGDGSGGTISVAIDVDVSAYPPTTPVLIYLYDSAVVAMSPSDSVPYLAQNGATITMGPASPAALTQAA